MTAVSDLTHAHRSVGAHRGRPGLTFPTRRAAAAVTGPARWTGRAARSSARVARVGVVAAVTFALTVAGPPVRAAWDDTKTLAGYWPGVAGLGCLVKAAAMFDPAAGWVAAGVALLLVGAVART